MRVNAVVAIAPIVADTERSTRLYRDDLQIDLYGEPPAYQGTEALDGVTHFGLWPLTEASRTCFGQEVWPEELPRPQVCIEFDVDDPHGAASELDRAGYRLLTRNDDDNVVRFVSPEGLVIVLSTGVVGDRDRSGATPTTT